MSPSRHVAIDCGATLHRELPCVMMGNIRVGSYVFVGLKNMEEN